MEAAARPVRRSGAPAWVAPTATVSATVLLLGFLAGGASAYLSEHDGWELLDLGATANLVALGCSLVLALAFGFLLPFSVRLTPGLAAGAERSDERRRRSQWIVTALVFFALVAFASRAVHPGTGDAARAPARTASTQSRAQDRAGGDESPVGVGVVGIAVGIGALAATALLVSRRRSTTTVARDDETTSLLPEAVDTTLDAVFAETDPRRAVILAYVGMESTLRARGIPRAAWESPREYIGRVFADLGDRSAPAETLTQLYEEARFADHEVEEGMRTRAQDALLQLRAALVAPV